MDKTKVIRLYLSAYLRSEVASLFENFDPTILTAKIRVEEALITNQDIKDIWATMKRELPPRIDSAFLDAFFRYS